MSGYRFSISYFVLSALSCAFVGVPLFFQINTSWNLSFIAQMVTITTLIWSILAGLMTVSFKMLNGGADLRRVSAIVLVFLLSFVGIAISQVIGGAFGLFLKWLSNIWMPIDAFILNSTYETLGYNKSHYLLTNFPSLSMILSMAVLGTLFGLPLARIGKGIRFADAWSQQAGKRWMLFWRCGASALVLSVIWAAVGLTVHSVFVEPMLTNSTLSDSDGSISQLTFYQPNLFAMSFSLGMNLMWFSLAVGFVAYIAEQTRQQSG